MPPLLDLSPTPEIEFVESATPSTAAAESLADSPFDLPPPTEVGRDVTSRARAREMAPLAALGLGLVATGSLFAAVGSGTLGGNTLVEFGLAKNDGIAINRSSRDCWTLVATGSTLLVAGGITLHFSREAFWLR